ncbi:unnamed protein product, partial [Amoebophrya sp. A25]|eukprot:GSA25T00002662001.1
MGHVVEDAAFIQSPGRPANINDDVSRTSSSTGVVPNGVVGAGTTTSGEVQLPSASPSSPPVVPSPSSPPPLSERYISVQLDRMPVLTRIRAQNVVVITEAERDTLLRELERGVLQQVASSSGEQVVDLVVVNTNHEMDGAVNGNEVAAHRNRQDSGNGNGIERGFDRSLRSMSSRSRSSGQGGQQDITNTAIFGPSSSPAAPVSVSGHDGRFSPPGRGGFRHHSARTGHHHRNLPSSYPAGGGVRVHSGLTRGPRFAHADIGQLRSELRARLEYGRTRWNDRALDLVVNESAVPIFQHADLSREEASREAGEAILDEPLMRR